jgi:hypothetical protein
MVFKKILGVVAYGLTIGAAALAIGCGSGDKGFECYQESQCKTEETCIDGYCQPKDGCTTDEDCGERVCDLESGKCVYALEDIIVEKEIGGEDIVGDNSPELNDVIENDYLDSGKDLGTDKTNLEETIDAQETCNNNCVPITFEKTFGGSQMDIGWSVQQTADGGYIIAGNTNSFGTGDSDIYVLKTDAAGKELWSKTFGEMGEDAARSIAKNADGGYIITGGIEKLPEELYSLFLIKIDADGNLKWNNTFGSDSVHYVGYSVQQTKKLEFIVGGLAEYPDKEHAFFLKTDNQGNKIWGKPISVGGGYTRSILQTVDGEYVLAGFGVPSGTTYKDVNLIKFSADGDLKWKKMFGDSAGDEGESVQQTADGGFIITGKAIPPGTNAEVYLIKTDSSGNEEWNKKFGGDKYDTGKSVRQTADGGFIVAGFTHSFGAGSSDVYLIRTDALGDELWSKTFGGSEGDDAFEIQLTNDGGFVLVGSTGSFGAGSNDVYLIKTDSNGNVE